MVRKTIIKTLECCTSSNSVSACMSGCPLYEKEDCECIDDDTALLKHALALIKELTEEVESWKKECASRTTVYCELHSKCEKLTEEVENYKNVAENQQSVSMERYFEIKRLTEENEEQDKAILNALHRIGEVRRETKADTVQRVQLELSIHFGTNTKNTTIKVCDLFKLIDEIADKILNKNTEDDLK